MTWCGCEVEKQSNCDEATEAKWVHVHVWWARDGCLRRGHEDGGGHHDVDDENVLHGGQYRYLQVNDDEIGEASLDPDSEGVFGGICQFGRVIFCVMTGELWMSAKYGHEERVLNEVHDRGLENELGADGCVDSHDQHDVRGGHGEELLVVHGFEKVLKAVLCQVWMSGHGGSGVWNVTWCPNWICRYGWMFFCGYVMRISLMWCENDGYCRRLVGWMMELEWVVVAKVVVELQQEVVVLQLEVVMPLEVVRPLEVVKVLVLVEVVEWLCESWMPRSIQSCVEVQE